MMTSPDYQQDVKPKVGPSAFVSSISVFKKLRFEEETFILSCPLPPRLSIIITHMSLFYCPCLDACVDTYGVFGHGGQPRWTGIGFIFKDVVGPHVGVVQTITMPR